MDLYKYYEDHSFIALDASGYFSSQQVHCENCCEKHHKDGTITFYHQLLAAVIINPSYKTVFPMMIEPIKKQDGNTKNDCGTPRGVYQLGVKVPAGKQNLMYPVSSFELTEVTT